MSGGRVRRFFARLRERPLTRGERIAIYFTLALSLFALPVGAGLAILGVGVVRAVGLGLLLLYATSMAAPVGPIIEGRVKRREKSLRQPTAEEQAPRAGP